VFKAAHTREKRGVYIAVGNHWMNNPYSITKTTAERFAFMYNRELGTKFAVVRGLNVYGPGQKAKPVRKVVPNLILPALKNEPITIYGDGTQIMDMIHIRDISEILVRALVMQHGVYDRVFEAGMGDDTTVNDLANLIIEEAGSKSTLDHVPMRPGELPNSVVKADPMTLAPLDYLPERMIPLRAGIAETIKWYR
jgi:UDP-glucose 4-epimerase